MSSGKYITTLFNLHHIPEHANLVIKGLYIKFPSIYSFIRFPNSFYICWSRCIARRLSQSSLFNMCFITFIQHIKAEKHRQFGFSCKLLNPIHWFQFGDNAAVITTQVSENQRLLNRFSIWCQWSSMIIRVDIPTLASLENPFNIWIDSLISGCQMINTNLN